MSGTNEPWYHPTYVLTKLSIRRFLPLTQAYALTYTKYRNSFRQRTRANLPEKTASATRCQNARTMRVSL